MNFQPPEQDDPRDDDDREQARDWSKIESFVDEYIDGYEMIGESEDGRDACYTPNANDRALLRDCMAGLLAEQAFIEMLSAPQIQPPQDERCPVCGEDEPFTGTCGAGDNPRALCNRRRAEPEQPVALSTLTDERIDEWTQTIAKYHVWGYQITGMQQIREFARAIERDVLAASAPAQPVMADGVTNALRRLECAVDHHLGRSAWTQTKHLKGFGYSEQVRKELYAAHDAARAALSGTGSDESKKGEA